MTQSTIDDLKGSRSQLQILVEKAEKSGEEDKLIMGNALKSICEALLEIGGPAKPQAGPLPRTVTAPTPRNH